MKDKLRNWGYLFVFFAGFIFFNLPASTLRAEGVAAPQQAVETFLKTIRSMQFPVQDQTKHDQLTHSANAYLDLEAMGKKSLEAHWQEASLEEQQKFMELLWKLIEYVAYPRSVKFMGDYQITYPEVRPAEKGFEVHSIIKQQAEGLEAKVIYHAYQNSADAQWKIDDIVLDDVSITEDLKYQFDKIIMQSKFSGLLAKMKERLEQAKKENGLAQA